MQQDLVDADALIDGVSSERLSLAPNRLRATPLVELGAQLLPALSPDARGAFTTGLQTIAGAIVEYFPENIFWDLDYLAAVLCAQQRREAIERMTDAVVALQRGFGRGTPIRFRYAHDFLFGFDWARWVAKDPEAREHVRAFDAEFLTYLQARRAELVALIAADDEKYPTLPNGEPRNPFKFSREPEAERALHVALAADSLIPLQAWDSAGPCDWDRPYTRLREEYAQRLRLE